MYLGIYKTGYIFRLCHNLSIIVLENPVFFFQSPKSEFTWQTVMDRASQLSNMQILKLGVVQYTLANCSGSGGGH